MIGQFFTS